MAKRTETLFIDDLDGSPAVETIVYGIDKSVYELDVSEANAAKVRDMLAPIIQASRVVKKAPRKRTPKENQDAIQKKATEGSAGS